MTEIIILNSSFKRQAKTSKAFEVSVTKELMRGYTMSAMFVNNDPARSYLSNTSILELSGQRYDIVGYSMISGIDNTTQVNCEHVSYRLNNYLLPENYAFVGTVKQIAQDILNTAVNSKGQAASGEFKIGTAPVNTVSLQLQNTQEVTARSAFLAMQALGVECEFDNFTVNLPQKAGTGNSKTFEFGRDLVSISRSWTRDNGTTYTAAIADLQRLPGHEGDVFDVGDTVTIKDDFIGDTITRRVISYTFDMDNPQNDSITLGVFVRDSATNAIANDVAIDNSLQEGKKYSNVYINHTDGVVAENRDATKRVLMNADECFVVEIKSGGKWKKASGINDKGLAAACIEDPDRPGWGAIIGKGPESVDGPGLFLYDDKNGTPYNIYCKIWPSSTNYTVIESLRGGIIFKPSGPISAQASRIALQVGSDMTLNISETETRLAQTMGVTKDKVMIYKDVSINGTANGKISLTDVDITVKSGLITNWQYK